MAIFDNYSSDREPNALSYLRRDLTGCDMKTGCLRFAHRLRFVPVLFVLLLAVLAWSQTADDLVLLNVTVTGEYYAPLDVKLTKENFQIFEDKHEQEIQYFSTAETAISLGILFDVSASMKGEYMDLVEVARRALIEFLRACNPQDEVFMMAFSDHPEMIFDFAPLTAVQDIPHLKTRKRTALLDTVYFGIEKMQAAHNSRKVLLIISDGEDNQSHHSQKEIRERLRETDVQFESICILDPRMPMPLAMNGPQLLSSITDPTGGATVCADPNGLLDAAKRLAAVLRNQYVLGYRSKNTVRDRGWRKIEVKLVKAKGTKASHVYYKAGYYPPSP